MLGNIAAQSSRLTVHHGIKGNDSLMPVLILCTHTLLFSFFEWQIEINMKNKNKNIKIGKLDTGNGNWDKNNYHQENGENENGRKLEIENIVVRKRSGEKAILFYQ